MSGGSWDYVHYKFEEVAERLLDYRQSSSRRALGKHVELIAKALRAIEWVDSGDSGVGAEEDAIQAALGINAKQIVLGELVSGVEISINKFLSELETLK